MDVMICMLCDVPFTMYNMCYVMYAMSPEERKVMLKRFAAARHVFSLTLHPDISRYRGIRFTL